MASSTPSWFYANFQAVHLGLHGMKIEDRAREILPDAGRLQAKFFRFSEDFASFGRRPGHAQASYRSAEKRLESFGRKLLAAVEPQEPPQR